MLRMLRRAAVALVFVLLVAPGRAEAARVVVNGTALQQQPVEQAGRLYVPLRAIFEALGASVVYQAGVINATAGRRTVQLSIGSTTATVDGRTETLDGAPFIVGAATYVPLRFVSQALGASVNYNSSTAIAYVDQNGPPPPEGPPPPRPVRPQPIPVRPPVQPQPVPVPAESLVHLRNHVPAIGSTVAARRPTVSADFTYHVRPNSVRVRLDGLDVSAEATRSETGIVYEPPSPLQPGRHVVVVSGQDTTGARFERSWAFSIAAAPAAKNFVTLALPKPDANVGRTFVVRGSTLPNARVHITAGRISISNLADVFAFLGGAANVDVAAGPRGNFERSITIALPAAGKVGLTVSSTAPGGEGAQARIRLNGVVPQPR